MQSVSPYLTFPNIAATLVFSVVLFYLNVKWKHSYWRRKGVKHVKPRFFLGNMNIYRKIAQAEEVQRLYREFPEERYHGLYQFLQPTLMIKDLDLIKKITIKDFGHFVDRRTIVAENVDPFWSRTLFASQGARWRDLRTTLSSAFTSAKMRKMYVLIVECAHQFVDYFKSDESTEMVELEMKDTLRRYSLDVIASNAFGFKLDSLRERNNPFYTMGIAATNFGGFNMLKFFANDLCPILNQIFRVRLIPKHVANYFSKIIKDTVKEREDENISRNDMIDLMMNMKKGRMEEEESRSREGFSIPATPEKQKPLRQITLDDIVSQAFIFFFAGFETVSTFLTFAVYELAVNPDVQSRLREEISSVEEKVTYEELLGLEYLDKVVSEMLRKWPAVTVADRKVTRDYTIEPTKPGEKPFLLEKGVICWLPIFAIHRDEKYYPEPEKFDPERFNEENKPNLKDSYFPFGMGPRGCLGMRFAVLEGKVFIFHLLKNFEIVPVERTPIPMVLDTHQVNLTPKGGLYLGLRKI